MHPLDAEYRTLLELRTGLRRFLRWSEHQARAVGLTPAQHQLLLAIRGHHDPKGPTIGEVADYLLLRHHSAVGLVDRAETAGLAARVPDPDNRSLVRLRLTEKGARQLEELSELHLEELSHLAPTMHALWDALERAEQRDALKGRHPAARARWAEATGNGEHAPRRARRHSGSGSSEPSGVKRPERETHRT